MRNTAIKKGLNKLVVLFIQNSDIYKEVKNMSSTMNYQLNTSDEQIAQYCTKNGIKKLSFFGSVLTDKFTSESDIDILVEFEDEKIPGLLALTRMERELSELFGRNVDLKTPAELSSYFRSEVVKEAEVKYG